MNKETYINYKRKKKKEWKNFKIIIESQERSADHPLVRRITGKGGKGRRGRGRGKAGGIGVSTKRQGIGKDKGMGREAGKRAGQVGKRGREKGETGITGR